MKPDTAFKMLLGPCSVSGMELRNRIVLAAMGTNYASAEGFVTERHLGFYEERAKGGVGTVIVGCAAIHLTGKVSTNQICVYDDQYVAGLAGLADVIKRQGARAILQLQHGGRYCYPDRIGGHEPVAPSPIAMPGRVPPHELTTKEIADLVDNFIRGAERAKKAGFDGVEVHGGHGYLLDQFLSPASNKRQDAYGGDLNGRARMLLEVVKGIKEKVGTTYPVWCRIDSREFGIEGGITAEDSIQLAQLLEKSGVHAIHVSGYGGAHNFNFTEGMLVYEPGKLVPYAAGIKKAVGIPVIAVGRIDPEMAEKVLQQGQADLIAMARPLLADPELPRKLAAGQLDDIRPCICCYTCIHKIFLSQGTACAVNAAAGKERELALKPADKVKQVAVVGGGPAGMEAATAAARRGHRVTLYEKGGYLGGSLFFASVLNPENQRLLDYLRRQVGKAALNVRLGSVFAAGTIAGQKPEAVVVASGPKLLPPQIPGAGRKNVITGGEMRKMIGGQLGADAARRIGWGRRMMLTLAGPILSRIQNPATIRRLSGFWMPLGKTVAVVGSDFVACEVAEFLSHSGRKSILIAAKADIATEMAIPARWKLVESLRRSGVDVMSGVAPKEITPDGVVITGKDGQERTVKADSIVLTEEIAANKDLLNAVEGKVPAIFSAGDCNGLGLIEKAIADGAGIAARL